MNASPLFPRFEIPLLGVSWLPADPGLAATARAAADDYLVPGFGDDVPTAIRDEFGIDGPLAVSGTIASGDRFVSSASEKEELRSGIADVLCVEMEGADIDFVRFVGHVASTYAVGIVTRMLDVYPDRVTTKNRIAERA